MTPQGLFRGAAAARSAVSNPIEAALALRAKGEAEEALRVLAGDTGFSADLCNLRGDLQMELGRTAEAVGSYSALLASERDNLHALAGLAACYRALGRWEETAEAYRRLLAHDPHRDDARLGLGDCLLRLGRLEEALSCFELCWSKAARPRAEFGKGVALQLLRRADEAEKAYERALALDPKLDEALSNLIAMSMEALDLKRVQQLSLRLLEVRPQSVIALQGLTLVAVERREYDEAARYFARLPERARRGEQGPDSGHGEPVEYRLGADVVARLDQTRRASAGRAARLGGDRH